ncbi:uncharacterized protein PV06_05424 [Exophiala oligosperma]|uniref:Thiolase-like protein type 1 additional C-terminal domain-containing protein n=1 Tax=Exophiala oligosperma TaxID=215243 RepID=A0A0D2BWG3_9EURO|nr:uncharacterized protein PV06_05424 [Exophiala oligosperma]KIW41817.1 hypothetical protein PV06_05424 [Exophiala oligosperma]
MSDRATPIIVGIGEFKNPSKQCKDAIEPRSMMLKAINKAIKDVKLFSTVEEKLRADIDSIDVVETWSWSYPDLPGLLANDLKATVKHKAEYRSGGNAPTLALDEAARRIANKECQVAIVTGGEAIASREACEKIGQIPPAGSTQVDSTAPAISPKTMVYPPGLSEAHKIGRPTQIYPMYEIALAAHRNQTMEANNEESAQLYAEFAKVSARNATAWSHGKEPWTSKEIGTVTQRNRLIALPYPLLMNGLNSVNLSAAVVLTSTEYAENLGIAKQKWIYMLGGAGTSDASLLWDRPNFYESPCISATLDAVMQVSRTNAKEIDLFDIYSCFPIVPKLAAIHLGLPIHGGPKPLSLIGSMTSFGGAGNNFSMHGVAEMVRVLRRRKRGTRGLVLGNGGNVTYQHALVLSANPPAMGQEYPRENPLPKLLDVRGPAIDSRPEGKATIETYTVEFSRGGEPETAIIIGLLEKTGHRFVANHADRATLNTLSSKVDNHVGNRGYVKPDQSHPGRNVFALEQNDRTGMQKALAQPKL